MNANIRAAVLCVAMLATPSLAQEEVTPPSPTPPPSEPQAAEATPPPKAQAPLGDPPLHRWGGLTFELGSWSPHLANESYEYALLVGENRSVVLEMPTTSHIRESERVTYHLPNNLGAIRFVYDSMQHTDQVKIFTPGQFQFGELVTTALFAGLNDDGLADGVQASSDTKTREFRVEYEQTAFETPRAKGTFQVGLRFVDHSRSLSAVYYALVPTFPPLLPPKFPENFDPRYLFPIPDEAQTGSDFSGNGLGAGFEVEFPLHRRVSIIGGLSVGILRGVIDTKYSSTTSAYFYPAGGVPALISFSDVYEILDLGTLADAGSIFQDEYEPVLNESASRLIYDLDVFLGIQGKLWRSLEVSVGMREMAYLNVGADVRPGTPVIQPSGAYNLQTVSTTDRSVGYGGYFVSLSYRF